MFTTSPPSPTTSSTKEDAEFLTRAGSLTPDRILGIETGGCPHTAIREDASINMAGVADLQRRFPALGHHPLIESGGDNLAATFSPELADITIYVIDVSAGRQDSTQGVDRASPVSDLLVINKIDLAPYVVRESGGDGPRFAAHAPVSGPFVFTNIRAGQGVAEIAAFHRAAGRSPPCGVKMDAFFEAAPIRYSRTFAEGLGEVDVICIYEIEDGKIAKAWFKMGEPRLHEPARLISMLHVKER